MPAPAAGVCDSCIIRKGVSAGTDGRAVGGKRRCRSRRKREGEKRRRIHQPPGVCGYEQRTADPGPGRRRRGQRPGSVPAGGLQEQRVHEGLFCPGLCRSSGLAGRNIRPVSVRKRRARKRRCRKRRCRKRRLRKRRFRERGIRGRCCHSLSRQRPVHGPHIQLYDTGLHDLR